MGGSGPVTATSISAYHYSNASWVQTALYADNGFGMAPTALLSQSGAYYVTANGWITFDMPDVPLVAPTTCWIAFQADSGPLWAWDTGPAGILVGNSLSAYTPGFPGSFTASGSSFNYQVSAYINTCP